MVFGGRGLFVSWGLRAHRRPGQLAPLGGGKWDILLFISFFGSEFGSLNPQKLA